MIVPTRDRPELLRCALQSVRAQDCEDYECIVVDDGSRDFSATSRVVHELRDDRFRLIQSRDAQTSSAENLSRFGKGLAMNAGIEAATSDWLAFLDDDDVFAPYRLSRGLQSVVSQPEVRITVARAGQFSTEAPTWPPGTDVRLRKVRNPLAEMMPHASTWTLSRSLAYDAGLFRPYGVLEDWEFYSRLCSLTAIWKDEAVTSAIRRHDGVRSNYGLHARIAMRRTLVRSGALSPNRASHAFQLYRLSLLEMRAGFNRDAAGHALRSLVPVPYPRYVRQALRALLHGLRGTAATYERIDERQPAAE